MLEVMISIVILAFGLLGIAGLQAFSLKNTHSASMRLTATELANDMIDRMKTNHTGVSNNGYNKPDSKDYGAGGVDCNGNVCSPQDLAQFDLNQWQLRVAGALPGGIGIVCVDSTPVDGPNPGDARCDGAGTVMYAVKIWWNDDRTTRALNPQPQLFWTAFNP